MNKENLHDIIDNSKYQVIFLETPMNFPINFIATHTFIVTNEKGNLHRWEVWKNTFVGKNQSVLSHLHKDLLNLSNGLYILPIYNSTKEYEGKFFTKRFKVRILGKVEGKDENSQAKKMINFIKKSYLTYKYINDYKMLPGPNSNTYPQWVLDNFPNVKIKLSRKALGKNYKY